MKFSELPENVKDMAREALANAVTERGVIGEINEYKALGESVAAAFVKMERYDSAPDVCAD